MGCLLARLLGPEPQVRRALRRLGRHLRRLGGAGHRLGAAARPSDSERDTILTVVDRHRPLDRRDDPLPDAGRRCSASDHSAAGLFLGGTIHDVAQVVGAGYTDLATDRRRRDLCEAAARGHAAAGRAGHRLRRGPPRRRAAQTSRPKRARLFLLGFAALVVANSLGAVAQPS